MFAASWGSMGASIDNWLTVNPLGARRKRSRHDHYLPVSATVVPAPITVVAATIAVVISATVIPATIVVSTVVTGVSLSGSCQTTKAADGHS
jgi:hypothetical protein